MTVWRQFPFLKLSLALVAGITTGFITSPGEISCLWLLPHYLLSVVIIFLPRKTLSYRLRWIPGFVILLFIVFLGFQMVSFRQENRAARQFFGQRMICTGHITEPVVQKEKSVKLVLTLQAVKNTGGWRSVNNKVLVYVEKDSLSSSLFYGDRIIFRSVLGEPAPALNPGGFNSREYLRCRSIFLQGFVRKGNWMVLQRNDRNPVVSLALRLRDRMLAVFRAAGLRGQEYAVASALLLGYTDEVDQSTMQDYSATGAMHVLSVSGMHVGVIFIFLEKILSFVFRRKRENLLKSMIIITFIWMYALITGLSPAVLRSAAMISLVIIAGTTKRHTSIFNVLGVSLFFLLFWNPGLLFDVGFLLSYTAVAGIVLLYKPLSELWFPRNKILVSIWSIVAVSLAAQLATLPLCLYYFHQFPNYFLLTNLLIVPFSNLVIYTGIGCLLLGNLPVVSGISGFILQWMVRLMNGSIHWIGALPFSVTRGIMVSLPEMQLLYLMIGFFTAYFFLKKKRWIFLGFFVAVLFSIVTFVNEIQRINKSSIIIYSTRGTFLMDCLHAGTSYVVGNLPALEDPYFDQTFRKNHENLKVSNEIRLLMRPGKENDAVFRYHDEILKTTHFVEFRGNRIVMVNKKFTCEDQKFIPADILILSDNPKVKLAALLRVFTIKQIVIDASNAAYRVKSWEKEADSLHVRCHSIKNNGAFVYEF